MPMKLISHGLTPKHQLHGIRSLISFGRLCGPLGYSVLYLRKSNLRLALKLFRGEPAISRFDWNFSAIHKSSPPFSTDVWFGPPWNFTPTSTCSWIGHLVSGLRHATSFALFRLAFAAAPSFTLLTSLHTVTRRSVLQKVRDRTCLVLSLLVNTGFQVLFHSPPGVLFTFPSRYYALSVAIRL